MSDDGHRITLGDLRRHLREFDDDTEVTFGATRAAVPLVFCRVKRRGDRLVQIELDELFPDGH